MSERQRRPGTGKEIIPGSGKGKTSGLVQPGAESGTEPGAPGQIIYHPDPVVINAGRPVVTVTVVNTADRPISVGSHYHFAEANEALEFDRDLAWGHRMNILAGAMKRFDPGATVEVELIPLGGRRVVRGLRGKCGGSLDD
ncbi:urease subunit beta [Actinomadura sp. 9N407]|uniref:urease subunit beta n=1 Tax=Actinomadura sp. 9N407 TaxID=3375154 RepID=UPI0037AFE7D4